MLVRDDRIALHTTYVEQEPFVLRPSMKSHWGHANDLREKDDYVPVVRAEAYNCFRGFTFNPRLDGSRFCICMRLVDLLKVHHREI